MALTLETISIATILIFLWACTISHATSRTFYESSSIAKQHDEWMASFGRVYADDAEKARRQQIFKDNLDFIQKHNNQANKGYNLSLNSYADLTNKEFLAYYTGALYKPPTQFGSSKTNNIFAHQNVSLSDIESSLDWRKKGAVNEIKNQHRCGSCWAFSAVAAVEGITKIKSGKLISLSEQQLVDCASEDGCGGSLPEKAFDYIAQSQGLASEAEYPYKGTDGTCNDEMINPAAKISGYEQVPSQSEEDLLKAVAKQPVSVAIDASGRAFQFYNGGLFSGECGTQLNHAVTLIGYGEETNVKYWLVRNSWGKDWGEGGYIKMQRDVGSPEGLCGITLQASYPTV
ncbi:Peptidase C1A, papain C-terminal [Sesbania bispinosa]|nr:Peptidase C1A, papain C-terminal [Sesbania bispinosa]